MFGFVAEGDAGEGAGRPVGAGLENGLRIARGWFEACGNPSAPDISPKNIGVFVPSEPDGLIQGLA